MSSVVSRGRVLPFVAALLCLTTLQAAWCDLVFKDVVLDAEVVVIARYVVEGGAPRAEVVEVLKGEMELTTLLLSSEELKSYRLKEHDQLVVALSSDFRPLRTVPGTGACVAVSILPIRRGKLKGRDRQDYDFTTKTMTLAELRAELVQLLRPGS